MKISKPESVKLTEDEKAEVTKAADKTGVKNHKFMKDAILSKAKRVNRIK